MAQGLEPQVDDAGQADPAPAPEPSAGGTRRGLLIGAGLAGVAGLAAACGGSDDSGDGSGGASGEQAAPGSGDAAGGNADGGGAGGAALASASEIPVGGGKVFKDQKVVVTQPAEGQFKAFSANCTHRGCAVGSVSGGTINCPCHGSKFKIADGSVVSPPADEPLAEQKITVRDGKITLG